MKNWLMMVPLLLITFTLVLGDEYDAIKINEFMASNIYNQLNSDYSDFVDWIELYNSGTNPVNLGALSLTDNLNNPGKWLKLGSAKLQIEFSYVPIIIGFCESYIIYWIEKVIVRIFFTSFIHQTVCYNGIIWNPIC